MKHLPAPLDVVRALMDRAWDEDTTDDDRILLETAALTLERTLDRCVILAAKNERTEAGL